MELKAIADTVNGIFEAGGTVTGLINLLALRRDKKVQGVHWSPYLWYTSWGLWNLLFYPIYGAWLSFIGGIGVVTMNSLWLAHVYYYWRQSVANRQERSNPAQA